MNFTIELKLEANGKGAFVIEQGDKRMAEMGIGISGGNIIIYHTEVSQELKGQGIAPKLLATMVQYARDHNLKVIALCTYVSSQFKRHPEQYADIWNEGWHKT